jgi:hypothetical protein
LETSAGTACQELSPSLPLTREQQARLKREREKEYREREKRRQKAG